MKRFLLFAGSNFYPEGGWRDFRGSFDTVAEAQNAACALAEEFGIDWHHIVDSLGGIWVPL